MAIGANICCFRMALRFAFGHVVVMTTKASCRDTLEHRACMAGFAGYLGVGAFKFKIGKLVVKIQINLDRIRRRLREGLHTNAKHH